jgi:phospholipid transport system substrate-binding protein
MLSLGRSRALCLALTASFAAVLTTLAPSLPSAFGQTPTATPKPKKKPAQTKDAGALAPGAKRAASTSTAEDSSPMAELKASNAQLKKVLQKQAPSWSPETDVRQSEVRKVVDNFLDFEELSRRALAKNWEGLTPKQRTEFVETLQELVQRSYLKQIHGQPNYDLVFDKEAKTGNEATVNATLNAARKGKKIKVSLEYKMVFKEGRWVVYDVITDEQSLLENYRAEFNRVINKDGFDALLKKMKKKLQEKAAP